MTKKRRAHVRIRIAVVKPDDDTYDLGMRFKTVYQGAVYHRRTRRGLQAMVDRMTRAYGIRQIPHESDRKKAWEEFNADHGIQKKRHLQFRPRRKAQEE